MTNESIRKHSLRALTGEEVRRLEAQENRAENWENIRVTDGFDAGLAHRCRFGGNAEIGRNAVMTDAVITSSNGGGNNSVAELKIINENGGRAIIPCPNITCTGAFIWAKYRGDNELTAKFSQIALSYYLDNNGKYTHRTVIGDNCYIGAGVQIRNSIIGDDCRIDSAAQINNSVIGCGNRIDTAAQLDGVMTGECVSISKAARVSDSFIGDCAHIACCEIANCYAAPFHSQHHNNSFLIAAMIGGQSNVAAGATIGSNHNSRSNDGEIWAKRGFWPGLCASLKHNSRFASFTMIAKGDYPAELDVKLPFSLVARDEKNGETVIHPAFWFTRNMYAAMRTAQKFVGRDNRTRRGQFIEHDMLAPDTVEEMFEAIRLLASIGQSPLTMEKGGGAVIKNADEAINAYKMMIRHYCAKNILPFMRDSGIKSISGLTHALGPISGDDDIWLNCGSMVISETALSEIINAVKNDNVSSWADVNALFDAWAKTYETAKIKHAIKSLARLQGITGNRLSDNVLQTFIKGAAEDCATIIALTKSSRQKDFADPFRSMVYDSPEEMEAVLGRLDDDPVIAQTIREMDFIFWAG